MLSDIFLYNLVSFSEASFAYFSANEYVSLFFIFFTFLNIVCFCSGRRLLHNSVIGCPFKIYEQYYLPNNEYLPSQHTFALHLLQDSSYDCCYSTSSVFSERCSFPGLLGGRLCFRLLLFFSYLQVITSDDETVGKYQRSLNIIIIIIISQLISQPTIKNISWNNMTQYSILRITPQLTQILHAITFMTNRHLILVCG